MHQLIEQLLAKSPVVTDGAWGTELQARGLEVGACPDAWNLARPDCVEAVARAYVDAGSQVILTNTFGSNRLAMARYDLQDQVVELNRLGVTISRRAAGERAKVFASVGPSGKMLMMGEVTPEQLEAAFAEQAQAIAAAGADAIVIEAMTDPAEAIAAVKAAKNAGLPVVACMSFDSGKDHDRTMMGTTPEQAAEKLTEAGADVIGSNCGHGIEGFVGICRRLKAATDLPIWIKANAGLPEVIGGLAIYAQSAEEFASFVPALVEAGASFIGGCCGTTPRFIDAVTAAIRRG